MKYRSIVSIFFVFALFLSSCDKSSDEEVKPDYTRKSDVQSSAYISEIIEYKPAPGQVISGAKLNDADNILGEPSSKFISLGGFGGYVIAKFDHTVLNGEGRDIEVYGNAFNGSSEPGIVMISFDANGNGNADDEWYELAGSEYQAENTIHNYEITYVNSHKYADVVWTDNQGQSGVVKVNQFYRNNYYPSFIAEQERVTFRGTLLENKIEFDHQTSSNGKLIWNPAREWGYADNFSSEYSESKSNTFDIEWTVNAEGEKVELPGVDFIKIYTATNVNGGILGENSTEIMGVADKKLLN